MSASKKRAATKHAQDIVTTLQRLEPAPVQRKTYLEVLVGLPKKLVSAGALLTCTFGILIASFLRSDNIFWIFFPVFILNVGAVFREIWCDTDF